MNGRFGPRASTVLILNRADRDAESGQGCTGRGRDFVMSLNAMNAPASEPAVKPVWDSLREHEVRPSAPSEDGGCPPVEESSPGCAQKREVAWVWGLPLAPFTLTETVDLIGELVKAGRPSFFITAPTHYAMLTEQNADLRAINSRAAFILADGAPLVWASRWHGSPLPERVAGSDLIFELSREAAKKGHRLFLLGGADGVAGDAADRLKARYPGLEVVGTRCPPFRELTVEEQDSLFDCIRAARPDILLVAFGQPKGERWIDRHLAELGVPVSVQLGASLDFAAGRRRRAPLWMQKTGLEWAFRLGLEPGRLCKRYATNAWFILRMVGRDLRRAAQGRLSARYTSPPVRSSPDDMAP
jgi:N-acetylglucosaminyldiphosphoundecaprenol N-acetyl-beta-D-mannosaminyltransferase